jgi:phosphoserine phosphatase RsbU/P
MQEKISVFEASRMLYLTGDFYTVESLEDIYIHLEQVLTEILGQAEFTILFPDKLKNRIIPAYSTFPEPGEVQSWRFDLEGPLMQQVLHDFQTNADLNISEEPDMLALWPFPVKYVALLQEEKNNLGILILHKGLDESIIEPFPVYEVLEPIVRHFTQGLMRLQSMEVIEKSIEESTAKLLAINEIGELLGQLDLDTILAKIMSLSLQMIQAEVGSLMIADEEQLHSRVEWGLDDEAVRGIAMRDGQSMVDWVHQNKIPLIVEKLSEDNRFEISLPSRKIESILSIPLYTSTKNLGVLNVVNTQSGESFSPENMATLQTLSGLASTAIENAILHKEAVEREVFREQLRIARRIWEDILPKKLPEMPGLSIYAESIPASIVGGDFYDFIPLSETRLGVVIADVSGKGIPAAMIMNMAKSVLHIEAMRGAEPGAVLQTVNRLLYESTKADSFITLCYLLLDMEKRKVLISNAGHNPTLLFRPGQNRCRKLYSQNLPLAVLPDIDREQTEHDLEPGDFILLYTDGVTEAMNGKMDLYEDKRLHLLINGLESTIDAKDMVHAVMKDVDRFSEGTSRSDDTTVLALRLM